MPRRKVIAGNWKMHKTGEEAAEFVDALQNKILDKNIVGIILCAPFTSLFQIQKTLSGDKIGIGAQNMHWEEAGAFTGEISPRMLTAAGCTFVILGHSERRQLFGETNETVGKKVQTAFRHDLQPIVCIGETLDEREAGQVETVLGEQLQGALSGIDAAQMENVIVAYEPVWAIGTGVHATPEQAVEAHQYIRRWLNENIQDGVGVDTTVLYGGSMKPANAESLLRNEDIDGGLIGGASLDVEKFTKLVAIATELS